MKIIHKYNNTGITVSTIKRSGSSYLIHLLKCILPFDKFVYFQEERNEIPEVEEMYKQYYIKNFTFNSEYQNYVVKTFINRIDLYNYPNIPGTYNIFLIRRNIFEGTISQAYSEITKIWNFHEGTNYPSVEIPLDFFKSHLKQRINFLSKMIENKSNVQYDMFINYEDLSFNFTEDINFLSFSEVRNIKFYEIKSPNNTERIKNYSELEKYFNLVKLNIHIPNTIIKDGIIQNYTVQDQRV